MDSNDEGMHTATEALVAILPLTPMPMPGGKDQFYNLLAFLRDTDSFEARLKIIEDATRRHNEAVDVLGGAQRASAITADAEYALSTAQKTLNNANKDATTIREAADGDARGKKLELDEREKYLNLREEELESRSEAIGLEIQKSDALKAKAEELQTAAEELFAESQRTKEEYEEKLSKHKRLLSELGEGSSGERTL